MRKLLCACVITAVMLGACSSSNEFDPPVRIDYNYPSSEAVRARVGAELRRDDGISVNIMQEGTLSLVPNTVAISACCGNGSANQTLIVSDDGWLPQAAADAMVAALDPKTDRVQNVLWLIDRVHQWQATHPRAPKPAVTPADHGSFNWASAFGVLALTGIFLIAAYIMLVDPMIGRRRRRRRDLAARADDLAARADDQNSRVERGDTAGVYGRYPPAKMEGP